MKKLLLTLALIVGLSSLAFAAFDPQSSVTRNPHIGTISIALSRSVEPKQPTQQVLYSIQIYDQFGKLMDDRNGDLIPHLTAGQITQLQAFMDAMWTKAEAEILP